MGKDGKYKTNSERIHRLEEDVAAIDTLIGDGLLNEETHLFRLRNIVDNGRAIVHWLIALNVVSLLMTEANPASIIGIVAGLLSFTAAYFADTAALYNKMLFAQRLFYVTLISSTASFVVWLVEILIRSV